MDVTFTEKLKQLIDDNGPKYLEDNPYDVYKALISLNPTNKITAGAILMLLVSGVWDEVKWLDDEVELSKQIQKKCCYNKKMADRLTEIIKKLYSVDNQEEWINKQNEGLTQFLEETHVIQWTGFSVWDAGNGTVDCHYTAQIELCPTDAIREDEELQKMIRQNPFLTKEAIHHFYEENLQGYLDCEFEDYCTAEEYYQPVVEDFELDIRVDEWCKKNGFVMVLCEGEGDDDGYEPKLTGRWRW